MWQIMSFSGQALPFPIFQSRIAFTHIPQSPIFMKFCVTISLLLLLFPLPSFSLLPEDDANTLILARLLAENENLVKNWVENGVDIFYLNANYSVDTTNIRGLYRFYQDPFGGDVSTDLRAFVVLKSYVEQNEQEKTAVSSGNYPALKACFPNLPTQYDEFVEAPKILFTENMALCIQLAKWKDFLYRVVEGRILEAYWQGGLFSTAKRDALMSAYHILEGEGTGTDSLAVKNLKWIAQDLEGKISVMRYKKDAISYTLYPVLKECNAFYPRQYADFLTGDKHILDANTIRCFLPRISRSDRERIREIWDATDLSGRGTLDEDDEEIYVPTSKGSPEPKPGQPILENIAKLSPSTIIIDASTQFLVERTREEIVLAFFDQFQKRVDSLVELQYLFDNTHALLTNREILRIPSLGKAWQEAFELDLRLLPKSFERLVEESPDYAYLRENMGFRLYRFTYSLLDKDSLRLESGLKRLSKRSLADCASEMDTSFFLSNFLLEDFQANGEGRFLGIREQMKDLDERARTFFVAIQYQKAPEVFYSIRSGEGGKSLASLMKEQTQDFFEKEMTLAGLFSNIDRDIKALDFPERPEINQDNAAYYKQLLKDYLDELPGNLATLGSITKQMVRSAFLFKYFEDEMALYSDPHYRRLMGIVQGGIDLVGALESREPSRILVATIQVLDPFFEILQERQIELIHEMERSGSGSSSVEVSQAIHRLEQLKAVSQYLGFYGGFCLDVLGAKSAEEVKAALYRYAIPPGSYRLKRESLFSLEVGAMPAFYTGPEWVLDSTLKNRSLVSGFSAPVGISLSWGRRKTVGLDASHPYKFSMKKGKAQAKELSGWSLGLFFPIIDLSAPFSYRWKNGIDEGLPDEIYWQQILAPGAYIVWGIKGVPVSLSAGAQYVPRLRSISSTGNQTVDFDAIRAGINLSLDLPVFSIYKK